MHAYRVVEHCVDWRSDIERQRVTHYYAAANFAHAELLVRLQRPARRELHAGELREYIIQKIDLRDEWQATCWMRAMGYDPDLAAERHDDTVGVEVSRQIIAPDACGLHGPVFDLNALRPRMKRALVPIGVAITGAGFELDALLRGRSAAIYPLDLRKVPQWAMFLRAWLDFTDEWRLDNGLHAALERRLVRWNVSPVASSHVQAV